MKHLLVHSNTCQHQKAHTGHCSLRTVFGVAALSLSMAQTSVADIIWQDDFSMSNSDTLGSGWMEIENQNNDVAIYQNQLRLRDHQNGIDAAAWHQYSPAGFTDLSISFDWRATSSTEPSDMLFVGWNAGTPDWSPVWQTALGGSVFASVSLDLSSVPVESEMTLSFWLDVGASNETVYLDNLLLEGNPVSDIVDMIDATDTSIDDGTVTAVSEPGSLALLSLGSLFLLGTRQLGSARA